MRFPIALLLLTFIALFSFRADVVGEESPGTGFSCSRENIEKRLPAGMEAAAVEITEHGTIFILRHPGAVEPIGVLVFVSDRALVSFSTSQIKPENRKRELEKVTSDSLIPALKDSEMHGCLKRLEKYDARKSIGILEKAVDDFAQYGSLDSPSRKIGEVDSVLAAISYVLVVLSLFFTIFASREISRNLVEMGSRFATAVIIFSLSGLLIRLIAPHRMTMVFMGYGLMDTAITMENLPRYGVSAIALYHLIFKIFPEDHLYVLFANSIIGSANNIMIAAISFRLLGNANAAVILSALLSLTPLYVRDHTSESILVPALFWLFSSILFIQSFAFNGRLAALAASAVNLILATIARPELMFLAPVTYICFGAAIDWKFKKMRQNIQLVALAGIPLLAIFALNIFRLILVLQREIALSNFSDITWDFAGPLFSVLTEMNLVFHPSLFPVVTTIFAFIALFLAMPQERRRIFMLLVLSLPWFAVYFVDFNRESMMRLHIPGSILLTIASSAGFAGCAVRLRDIFSGKIAVAPIVLSLSFFWLVSSLWTTGEVFSRTNSDEEERFFRESVEALPDEKVAFVRIGYGDIPEFFDGRDIAGSVKGHTGRVHRYYPDYLLKNRGREDTILNINRFEAEWDGGLPVYFYLGIRCYAYHRLPMHPSCAAIFEKYRTEPVLEKKVMNRKEKSDIFQWYPEVSEFKLGLYRVTERSEL